MARAFGAESAFLAPHFTIRQTKGLRNIPPHVMGVVNPKHQGVVTGVQLTRQINVPLEAIVIHPPDALELSGRWLQPVPLAARCIRPRVAGCPPAQRELYMKVSMLNTCSSGATTRELRLKVSRPYWRTGIISMDKKSSIPLGCCVFTICLLLATGSRGETPAEKPKIVTRWAGSVQTEGDPFWSAPHPRPLLCREDGVVLDGLWDEAITAETADAPPTFSDKVLVPFSIGSPLSRVSRRPAAHEAIWYRCAVAVPPNWDVRERHVWLNFNSVDGNATVFVNGKEVGQHDGKDAFGIDITSALKNDPAARQDVAIKVSGTFEGRNGICQTVWLEPLRPDHVDRLDVSPDSPDGNVRLTAMCSGEIATQRVEVTVTDAGAEVARVSGKPGEAILLPIRDLKRWSPGHPLLYDLRVELHREQQRLDKVTSCLGIRSITVGNDSAGVPRILLNGKFEFQAGVIDAGRWPDGGSTAPSAPALRRDVEAVKQLGFNAIRKSGTIESDYWYYRCDRLGILVWQDVPKISRRK